MGLTCALDLLVLHLKTFGCDASFKVFCVICFMYVWTMIVVGVDMVAHNIRTSPLLICYNVEHVLNLEWIDMFYNDIFGDSPIGGHKTKHNFLYVPLYCARHILYSFDLTTFCSMERPLKTTIHIRWFNIRQDHRTRLITSLNGYWKKKNWLTMVYVF
jgi:hypothetical protein